MKTTTRCREARYGAKATGWSQPTLEILESRELLAADFHTLPVIPLIDASMQSRLQSVYRLGQSVGERANVFMKVGDSNSQSQDYLSPFGSSSYDPNLASFFGYSQSALASVLNYFRAGPIDPAGNNSFNHISAATQGGWTSTDMLTPGLRGFPPWFNVNPQDTPLQAEIDQTKPAIALIMIGTDDVPLENIGQYKYNLITIAQTLLSQGIIPVLSTIPEIEFADPTLPGLMNQYNQTIADVADQLTIPLLNLWVGLTPLPSMGVSADLVHLSVSPNGSSQMDAANIVFGMNYRNLTALATLNKLVGIVELNDTPDPTPPYLPAGIAPASFINAIFQSILQRAPDAGAQGQFGVQLQDGVSTTTIIQEVWLSPEHRDSQIAQYYSTYLGRAVDANGLSYWTQQFQQGATEDEVKVAFLTSGEYVGSHDSERVYIQSLYQNVLDRAASESELAQWDGYLRSGHSWGELCEMIVQSGEAQSRVIDGYYESYLGRPVDDIGIQVSLAILDNSPDGDLAAVQLLLTSAEYMGKI